MRVCEGGGGRPCLLLTPSIRRVSPTAGSCLCFVAALTITPASFAAGGWLAPAAVERYGVSTFLQELAYAATIKPKFLVICQWNEVCVCVCVGSPGGLYSTVLDHRARHACVCVHVCAHARQFAGQANTPGGEYADSYNTSLSNDLCVTRP
jgi:hypothetical protein